MKFSIRAISCALVLLALQMTASAQQVLRLGAATSAADSGLLNAIIPQFEAQSGIQVQVMPVGTGKALEMAETGQVDGVLSNSPHWEKIFMGMGYGVERLVVMESIFVLVGPKGDPVGIREEATIKGAFVRLFRAHERTNFVSRGDESGTNLKELDYWHEAGYLPESKSWYHRANQNNIGTLKLANELNAYMLIDRATWLKHQASFPNLGVVWAKTPPLSNLYSVITVSPHANPNVNRIAATKLAYWLTSAEGQQAIRSYTPGNTIAFQPRAAIN